MANISQPNNQHIYDQKYHKMVNLIHEVEQLYLSKPPIALKKAEQGKEIAQQLNEHTYEAKAWRYIGAINALLGNYDKAIDIAQTTINFIHQHLPEDKEIIPYVYNIAGVSYLRTSQFQAALKALLTASSFKYPPSLAGIYNNLGNVYDEIGDFPNAIKSWETTLKHVGKGPHTQLHTGIIYNIANGYYKQGEAQHAKQNLQSIIDIFEENEDLERNKKVTITTYLHSLRLFGDIYRKEKNYTASLKSLSHAVKIAKKHSIKPQIGELLFHKAITHIEKNEKETGIKILQDALVYTKQYKFEIITHDILKYLNDYYTSIGNTEKALHYLQQLYKIAQQKLEASRGEDFKKIINEREREILLLENKNKEIEKHNAILKQFAYIISHDLREPVRGINGFANLLNKKFKHQLGQTGKEYINFILSETGNINNKLARLLEYTSLKKPDSTEVRSISLQQIVEHQKKQFDSLCQLDIECNAEYLKINPHHAHLLIFELLDNAVKFRKDKYHCRIEIKSESQNDYQHISIKDFGIGIAEKYQQQIFKIFKQIDKQTEGAGVGLAICERIIGLYNGKIWIESVPNEFTKFHISISS